MINYMKNTYFYSYLLAGGAIILIASGIYGAIFGQTNNYIEIAQSQETDTIPLDSNPTLTIEGGQDIQKQVPTDLNNPDQLIEYYRSQIEENSQDPNTPAYLSAMGNLYKNRKMDCASAIPYYERIVIEFPDWDGIKSVYPELATCYETVNDYRGKIWIYEEMMRRFPEDSQEYLYAKSTLGLLSPSE